MADLKEIYLQKCSDFACEPIPLVLELFDSGKPLSVIDLSGKHPKLFKSRVQSMQVFALCEALYDEPTVQHILLPFNNLDDMAAQALARLIQVNKGVRMVDLRGNEVTAKGVAALAEVLSRPDCALQGLILRGNPVGDEGVMAIADMLRSNRSLALLDAADTRMGVRGVLALVNALTPSATPPSAADNTKLRVLDLEDVQIQPPQSSTVQHLCRMLSANTSLTELSLAKHKLVDSQLEELVAYGLAANRSITSLNLRANRLSPFAGPTLERLLTEASLQRLDLSHNALGSDGALALARCLPYCHGLRALDLRSNNIGEPGLTALAEALPLAQGLQELLVWGNAFGPGACRSFQDALAQPGLAALTTDIRPYEVDGEVHVALA